MAKRRLKNESFENMRSVASNAEKLDTIVSLDPVTADACIQHEVAENHIAEVKDELKERAEGLVPETEEPKNPVENGYTQLLRLDENFSNFELDEDYFDSHEYVISRLSEIDIPDALRFIEEQLDNLASKYADGKIDAATYANKLRKIYDCLTDNLLHKHFVEDMSVVMEASDDALANREKYPDNDDGAYGDKHLDFDMSDFIISLVTDADDLNPKIPEGVGKFDKFINTVDAEPENISGRYNIIDNETDDICGKLLLDLVKKTAVIAFDDDEYNYSTKKKEGNIISLKGSPKSHIVCDSFDNEFPAEALVFKNKTFSLCKRSSLNRMSQAGSDGTTVTVYADNVARFDTLINICDIYKLEYDGPKKSKNADAYWKYYLDIVIPIDASGLPMLAEDYFSELYPEEDEVMRKIMQPVFANPFYNKKKKQAAEQQAMEAEYQTKKNNDTAVRKALKSAITAASLDGSRELTDFLDDLYRELEGISYDKEAVTKEFMDAFADDYDDEEDE